MHRSTKAWLLAVPAAASASLPAAAQEFLSEAQALKSVFGENVVVRKAEKSLSDVERQKLEASSGLRFHERRYAFLVAQQNGRVTGYALVLDEIGKSEPITLLVAMSPEHKVLDVVILVFRETRGWEVKDKRFLRQFRGKTSGDAIRVDDDVVNYAGATLSSKAVARGTKRALLLFEHFFPGDTAKKPPAAGTVMPLALPGGIFHAREGVFSQARYRMGTLCDIRVCAESPREARAAFGAGFAELERLENIFSAYRPESELSEINREAGRRRVEVSPEMWFLLREALRHGRTSRGYFDVTVGPLLRAWGMRDGKPRVPCAQELESARALTGGDKLQFNARRRTVHFLLDGMELDFGGFAKGYAAERVARMLRRQGSVSVLVNVGGSSIYAAGEMPWVAGIAAPDNASRPAAYIELRDGQAMSTSGTGEGRLFAGEREWSHLLNPHSGMPVGALRSATVIARSGTLAEALSKPMLMSPEAERRLVLRSQPDVDWLLQEEPAGGKAQVQRRVKHTSLLVPV